MPLAEHVALTLEEERPSAEILKWPCALPKELVAMAGVAARAARLLAAGK